MVVHVVSRGQLLKCIFKKLFLDGFNVIKQLNVTAFLYLVLPNSLPVSLSFPSFSLETKLGICQFLCTT